MIASKRLMDAIRRHWAYEFQSGEWDCNWACLCGMNVIGPTRGNPDLSGCEMLFVDGVAFFVM